MTQEVMTTEDNAGLSLRLLSKLKIICAVLFLVIAFPLMAKADTIDLSVTYGYQNTAKAGRFLPLSITIENTGEKTFSGYIHVYMVESENSVYEYRYRKTVEGESEDVLSATVSLSSGVNQILVTAEDSKGELLGSRRVGLDVAGSDAELIIGLISQSPETLTYLGGVGINNGILRTRTVTLDTDNLPNDKKELDQLDVLFISDYNIQNLKEIEAETIIDWVKKGGVLVLGTGAKGNFALAPYFDGYLREPLMPREMKLNMGEQYSGGSGKNILDLNASAVTLTRGREVMYSDGVPIISTVTEGTGAIAVSGYDFCDIQRFATDQMFYVDDLFKAILGQNRLDKLSVAASERSLKRYWDIQALMNMSDLSKIPEPLFYVTILSAYVLLVGPGLYFYLRTHDMIRLYRPGVIVVTALAAMLVWVMGVGTRFSGPFLTYAKLNEVSKDSINEIDYVNLRSPYNSTYTFDVKSEYYVYPVLKGSDYNGDIQELSLDTETGHTTINNDRDKTEIIISNTDTFTGRYFEFNTKSPNPVGCFTTDMVYSNGKVVQGVLKNDSGYDLSDAAILIYGKVILIGKLGAGEEVDLSGKDIINVPVGDYQRIADTVTDGANLSFLKYYISDNMAGYYGDARLVGFVRESGMGERLSFSDQLNYDSYGVSMVVASLPLDTRVGDEYSYSVMSTDPEVRAGDYNISDNTISGVVPAVLAYHLGEGDNISSITIESLSPDDSGNPNHRIGNLRPFKGSLSFYNNRTGGFDPVDIGDGVLTDKELTYYLDEDNVLVVKYTPGEQNLGIDERMYLPMITVTVKENVTVINQILDNGTGDEQQEEVGPLPLDADGSVVADEIAPAVPATETEEGEAQDDLP